MGGARRRSNIKGAGFVVHMVMAENKPPVEAGTRTARYLELYDTSSPTNEAEVQALVAKYDLKHGDVLSFDEYRDVESQIVFCQDDGKITLIPNPDVSDAGYLTIPREVLINVDDALDLYRVVINNSKAGWGRINLCLSPQDKFVVDRLGQVPSDWYFDLVFLEGELDDFAV